MQGSNITHSLSIKYLYKYFETSCFNIFYTNAVEVTASVLYIYVFPTGILVVNV